MKTEILLVVFQNWLKLNNKFYIFFSQEPITLLLFCYKSLEEEHLIDSHVT